MRPLRYSINVTLDGCCDHRAITPDEDLFRNAVNNLAQADALLLGRVTYEMANRASIEKWISEQREHANPRSIAPS